jgi:hypothetical protein
VRGFLPPHQPAFSNDLFFTYRYLQSWYGRNFSLGNSLVIHEFEMEKLSLGIKQ